MPKDQSFEPTGKPLDTGSEALTIFIAAPMSGFDNDEDFQAAKRDISLLSATLRSMRKVKGVYFAGENVASTSQFTPNNNALISDISMLAEASRFLFVYPKKVLTSALVEVGFALGRGIRSHFFVKDRADLPYLLRDCHEVSSSFKEVPNISISVYSSGEDLARKARDRLYGA